jgi:signal transduction histidine kinase
MRNTDLQRVEPGFESIGRGGTVPRQSGWLVGRGVGPSDVAIGVLAVAASFAAAWIVTNGGVVLDPVGYSVVLVGNILSAALGGLLWLRARPWSPFGPVLLALALLDTVAALSGVRSPALFIGAVFVQWVAALCSTWLMISFPSGKLDAGGRVVMAVAAAVFLFVAIPQILVTRSVTGLAAVGRCAAACPRNPLLVAPHGALSHALSVTAGAGRTVWAVAIVALLASHFARASRPRRRMIAPVFATSLPFATVFGLNALLVDTLRSEALSTPWIHISFVITRMVFPLGFIGAILLAQAYAGVALSEMARELHVRPTVSGAERLVRRALDDATARVGFWLTGPNRFVDRHGRSLELEPNTEWVSWRTFTRGDEFTIVLEHDPALADYPELVDAVGSALLLAVENRRLQEDLLDSIHELRASQQRIATAAAAERRKMERDLHDSTQQKLIALRIKLELAREQAPPDFRSQLAELGQMLESAVNELRSLAHGIYPSLLSAEGLAPALAEAAREGVVPVDLRIETIERLPGELELAIYYCCLEALQNIAKHAGENAQAVLRLRREGRVIRFTVSDDGVGFRARRGAGAGGLANMNDRIAAVGGTLIIHSTPGHGTTIDGRVVAPLPATAENETAQTP